MADLQPSAPGTQGSFTRDVLPIFRRSCSASVCHGNAASAKAGLFLGTSSGGDSEALAIIGGIVDVASRTAPALMLVHAGFPEKSFMVLKLAGCSSDLQLACTPLPGSMSGKQCGDDMPQTGDLLDEADRSTIGSWIKAGGKDD